ncbi:hypothetical protein [Mariniblastus fucicola]|uniref:Uncharacterized protein n=1 Tax=Mariniblastus fucicola TaxID=980251 RepID=A0A5B9PDY6_9BACT|nr:hypothetical protein [Mariniblastus fucicola]QEG23350.1 hypothetical protein MFFC18_32480 [Mariniblastus fucicola]
MDTSGSRKYNPQTILMLRVSVALWGAWGLMHVFAGVAALSEDTPIAIEKIADAVHHNSASIEYPAVAGAIIKRQGFNLLWAGCVTLCCMVPIWHGSNFAIFLAALIGGLTELGRFLFLDLAGFVNFLPGTILTIICVTAIVASVGASLQIAAMDTELVINARQTNLG